MFGNALDNSSYVANRTTPLAFIVRQEKNHQLKKTAGGIDEETLLPDGDERAEA
jgi:hypothetical protein